MTDSNQDDGIDKIGQQTDEYGRPLANENEPTDGGTKTMPTSNNNRYSGGTGHGKNQETTRREFLGLTATEAAAAAGGTSLLGTAAAAISDTVLGTDYLPGIGDTSSDTQPGPGTDNNTGNQQTDNQPPQDPLEQTHQAESLEQVVSEELEQDSVTLNFVPADENADYAQSNIYSKFNGELTVELDLNQAKQQRHHQQLANQGENVQEFINNVTDEEWRQQYLETDSTVDFDWDIYTDESRNFRERVLDSGFHNLWYLFESEEMGGISSTNNQSKAAAWQGVESQLGFDTFIWDYGIPGHGLMGAIENPTNSEEEIDQQQLYVVETDFTDPIDQQVSTWSNSQYQNTGQHPVREGVEDESSSKGLYVRTAVGAYEGNIYNALDVDDSEIDQFVDFFRNPTSEPAENHLDQMAAAAYLAEENVVDEVGEDGGLGNGMVRLEDEEIEYSVQ